VLLYEAVIVAEVDTRTIDVLTANVALVLPAGMVTLDGTLAAPLLLESITCAPPAGAGPLSVTVPVEDPKGPPTTLFGFNVSDATVGGVTVSEADGVTPSKDTKMLATVATPTGLALTVKVALLLPAGMVTLEGTLATAALLLESVTCAPAAGAGPLSVTVPEDDWAPPVTLVGFNVTEEALGRTATAVTGSVMVWPLLIPIWEMYCPP